MKYSRHLENLRLVQPIELKSFSVAVALPRGQSGHVSTFAMVVESERFLSAFVRAVVELHSTFLT